jgi:hypothetical protein
VRHRDTPEFLPNCVAAREQLALGVADRQRAEVVNLTVAVNIQLGPAIDYINDLDNQPAIGSHPGGPLAIIRASRH